MKNFSLLSLFISTLFCTPCFATLPANLNEDSIAVAYQLMDGHLFKQTVVNHTVIGTTRHSHSLYSLYFAEDGSCELWKQNQIYSGTWWIEKDEAGKDFVRALWPDYSPNATAVWYYLDPQQTDALLVANKSYRASALLVPGRVFPFAK